ncbi:hypothetical protein SRHO_G00145010 [Serrasalmus rhombeus]
MRGPWSLVGDGVFADLRRSDGCVRRCTRRVQELTSPCNSIGGAGLFLQARRRCVQKTGLPVEARSQRRALRNKAKHLLSSQTETRTMMSSTMTDKYTNSKREKHDNVAMLTTAFQQRFRHQQSCQSGGCSWTDGGKS